jgi:hypothetical protein
MLRKFPNIPRNIAFGKTGVIYVRYQLPLCFGQFVLKVIFSCIVSVFVWCCYRVASPLAKESSRFSASVARKYFDRWAFLGI